MSIGLMRVWRDRNRLITVPWQTIVIFEHRSRRLLIQQRRRNAQPPGLQILFRRSVCRGSRRICRWLHETVGGLSKTFTVVVVFFEVRKPVWSHSQIFPQ